MVLTEPELIKEVLSNKDGVFPKTDVDDYGKKLLGYGLATSEGKKWARQRKLANRAFHGEMLKVNLCLLFLPLSLSLLSLYSFIHCLLLTMKGLLFY